MKQTELITGMGGEQGICRESGVRTVPGTGKRGCAAWTGVGLLQLREPQRQLGHSLHSERQDDLGG